MAPFKHIDLDTGHPKRKRTTNPKLLDDNNMSLEAIKRRKLESSTVPAASTSKSSSAKPNRQASVEAIADEDDMRGRNAGHPKNPRLILESVDDDDDDDDKLTHPAPKKTQTQMKTPNPSRQASVEAIADEDDMRHNAGQPKNPRLILESVDDNNNDDESTHPAPKKTQTQKKKTHHRDEKKAESCEEENQKDESDDEELSESHTPTQDKLI